MASFPTEQDDLIRDTPGDDTIDALGGNDRIVVTNGCRIARSAMAERMPDAVLRETRKGYQAADWYEGLASARGALEEEVASISACPLASSILYTDRMNMLLREWPKNGWSSPRVTQDYRLVLIRAVAAGSFIRRAACSGN